MSELAQAIWAGDSLTVADKLVTQKGAADQKGAAVNWDARKEKSGFIFPPLHFSAYHGRAKIAKLLLDAGGAVDQVDQYWRTPLSFASEQGHAAVTKLLIERGADINRSPSDGSTPLHNAACGGNLDVAELLMEAGANFNLTTKIPHVTALRRACFYGHLAIVKILASYGATRNLGDTKVAHDFGFPEIAAWLSAHADCTTPLHHPDLVPPSRARHLLRAGADLHAARDPGGRTPLSLARELQKSGDAPEGSTAWLVLRAAELGPEVVTGPWSRRNHLFWPETSRARAAELLWLGKWAVGEGKTEKTLPMAVWIDCIIPHAVE